MANYNVDIAVALKGAKQLTSFNREVKATSTNIDAFAKKLKSAAKDQTLLVRSFNNLNEVLARATKNFNAAATGSQQQFAAARQLITAEKNLNKEYQERERVLQSITLKGQRSSILPGQSLFGQSVTPKGGASGRSRKILAENQELQAALGSMEQRAFGKFKFLPPIQGTTESQLALKTRVSSNIAESQRIREIVAAGSNRENLGGGFKEFNKNAKKIQADTKKISTIVAQNQAQGIQAFGNQAYSQPIGPVRPGPLGRLGIGTGANPRGMFASSRGRAGRISGGLSNALIGGGFPLLFGQGALGAAGGGIGGAVGGALGGPFGFGLSIAGTAIATRIAEGQEFEKQIDKVNQSILATGSSATFTSEDIKKLGKTLGMTKQEALQAAQSFKAFDAAMRTSLLVTFGDEATFNLIKGLKTNVQLINDIQEAEEIIGRERADQLLMMLRTEGSLKVQKRLQDEIIKVRENERIGNKNKVNNFDRFMGLGRTLGNKYLNLFGQGPGAGNAQVTGEDIRDIRIDKILGENLEEKTAAVNQLGVEFERAMGLKLTENIAAVRDELEMLKDPITALTTLADTLGNAFGESFKGLIRGSMTAQEALRNLFQKTADHFSNMAAEMIAKQIQMKILGIAMNFFGERIGKTPSGSDLKSGSFGTGVGKVTDTAASIGRHAVGGAGAQPNFIPEKAKKANGGPVIGGSSYLVGERGPELFSPGVSGMITPNEMLGGSTNVVVNVDASGSSVEGDGQGQQFGEALATAIQLEIVKQKRSGGLLA